ncbi:MAG: hypothetical protein KIT17_03845 [Rubrivivax sp.]|nr:hypothetical protein [Rubrivivax sp.]
MSGPPLYRAGGAPTPGAVSTAPALAERARDLATRAQWLQAGLALVGECYDSTDPDKRNHGSWLADAMADLAERMAHAWDELAVELELERAAAAQG